MTNSLRKKLTNNEFKALRTVARFGPLCFVGSDEFPWRGNRGEWGFYSKKYSHGLWFDVIEAIYTLCNYGLLKQASDRAYHVQITTKGSNLLACANAKNHNLNRFDFEKSNLKDAEILRLEDDMHSRNVSYIYFKIRSFVASACGLVFGAAILYTVISFIMQD